MRITYTMRVILNIIATFALMSCFDKEENITTPAQAQIDEYSKHYYQDCRGEEKPVQNQKAESRGLSDNKAVQKQSSPIGSLEINEQDIVLGDANAKVVIIEYISPTCPHCAYYHREIFPKLQEKYINTNKIAYVVRNFIANKLDLDASILAYCPKDRELFLKFTNVILQQQESWSLSNKYREILTNIAGLGGMPAEKYAACLNDDKLVEFLLANSQAATKSPKFIGTPAFFINGVQFGGPYNIIDMSKAIDDALTNVQNVPRS